MKRVVLPLPKRTIVEQRMENVNFAVEKYLNVLVMINHVVLFKLKKYNSESEKQTEISNIEEALLSLSDKIDELKYIEVGVNYDLEAKSHDICLITHFESLDQLEAYRIHPEHLKVAELIGQHAIERAAVDFEF